MERVAEIGAMHDPEEVRSYDELSKRFLGLAEKRFVSRAIALLAGSANREDASVLDVGTGTANIPIRFVREAAVGLFVAADLSLNMLRKAKSNIRAAGVESQILLVNADTEHLPFKNESFHLVMSHSMIHHLANPLPAVNAIVRVTKQGGRFFIRDLRRPPSLILELYIRVFGMQYDWLMREMYRESLQAGFTFNEVKSMAGRIRGAVVKSRRFFITHVGLEAVRAE